MLSLSAAPSLTPSATRHFVAARLLSARPFELPTVMLYPNLYVRNHLTPAVPGRLWAFIGKRQGTHRALVVAPTVSSSAFAAILS